MTEFYDLPLILRVIALILTIAASWRAVLLYLKTRSLPQRRGIMLAAAAAIVVSGLLLGILRADFRADSEPPDLLPAWLYRIPAQTILAILVALLIGEMVLEALIRRSSERRITADSIKESFDALPEGLLFAAPSGEVYLINRSMTMLVDRLFDTALMNEQRAWQRVAARDFTGEVKVLYQSRKEVVVQFSDGMVRRIVRRDHDGIIECSALDETEAYRLTLQLRDSNRALARLNKRLRHFDQNVSEVTRQQEILKAKTRVHNDLAKTLVATRAYLYSAGGTVSRAELVEMWRHNVSVIRSSGQQEAPQDDLAQLQKAARSVGVAIHLTGQLPKDNPAHMLVIDAIHEAVNNTVKHAGGKNVFITIAGGSCTILNDGRPPQQEIAEAGGLANLRAAVQQAGGTMEVVSRPRLMIRIGLPKEAE